MTPAYLRDTKQKGYHVRPGPKEYCEWWSKEANATLDIAKPRVATGIWIESVK